MEITAASGHTHEAGWMGRVARACDSTCTTEKKGAPSLRLLQGRVRFCLSREILAESKTCTAGYIVPTLREKRAKNGAPSSAWLQGDQRLGHPPSDGGGSER
jgi:hypothetical protein